MIRWISYSAVILGAIIIVFAAWMLSLPRLDPTGKEDAGPALRAMIAGRPVRNTVSGWPMTQTGWPFFESYSPAPK